MSIETTGTTHPSVDRAEHARLVEQIETKPHPTECLSCRITGSAAMAGTGAYAIWQTRAAAPGSPAQKRIVAGLGLGEYTFKNIPNKPIDAVVQLSSLAVYLDGGHGDVSSFIYWFVRCDAYS